MVLVERMKIADDDTHLSLTEKLARIGAQLLIKALEKPGDLECTPQPEEGVLYAEKLLKSESRIDWNESAKVLARRMRAFTPFPGLQFEFENNQVKVWAADALDWPADKAPGTVLKADDALLVQCGENALSMTILQRAGKPRMPAHSAIQSLGIRPGDTLQ